MKNNLIYKIKSKVEVEISGKSVNRFVLRITKNKINIYSIKKINSEKYKIVIDYYNFDKLLKINTVYEIKISKYLGIVNTRYKLFKNIHVIFIFIISIICLYMLSNIIFKVEIVSNDSDIKSKLYSTLKYYDIKPYSIKKNYEY